MYMSWVKVHRKVMDNWLFREPRKFSRYEAWVYLLLTVNHRDNEFCLGGSPVEVKRGSTITSIKEKGSISRCSCSGGDADGKLQGDASQH